MKNSNEKLAVCGNISIMLWIDDQMLRARLTVEGEEKAWHGVAPYIAVNGNVAWGRAIQSALDDAGFIGLRPSSFSVYAR